MTLDVKVTDWSGAELTPRDCWSVHFPRELEAFGNFTSVSVISRVNVLGGPHMQLEPNLTQFYSNINLIVPSNGDGRIILK